MESWLVQEVPCLRANISRRATGRDWNCAAQHLTKMEVLGGTEGGSSMSIFALLLTLTVVLGIRLAIEQSDYFQKHAKRIPPIPIGL
jgi:hypothetical protein